MKGRANLMLRNYRGFKNEGLIDIEIAPLTLLTGVNGSGKSSVIEALMLLKNTNFKDIPYLLELDNKKYRSSNFDLLKNRHCSSDSFELALRLFSELLSEEVLVVFSYSKSNDFTAHIAKVRVFDENLNAIMDFQLGVSDMVDSCYLDIKYLLAKLKMWKSLTERYGKYSNQILADEVLSIRPYTSKMTVDVDMGEEFEKEYSRLSDEYTRIIEKNELPLNLRFSLRSFLESDSQTLKQLKGILQRYNPEELIVNYPLLNYILNVPRKDLNREWVRGLIQEKFPEYSHNLMKDDTDILIEEIIDFLKLKDYHELDDSFISGSNTTIKIDNPMSDSESGEGRVRFLIWEFLDCHMNEYQFLMSIKRLSTRILSKEIPIPIPDNPANLVTFNEFILAVYRSLIEGVQRELSTFEILPLNQPNTDRLLDIAHPISKLISQNRKTISDNPFMKRWLAEFEIGNSLIIETPVAGLGYSLIIESGGSKKHLNDEGSGIIHLIKLLLQISVFWSDYKINYTLLRRAPTLILEEPEANMHPAWQSKLVEMFVDAQESMGLNFIIETHSEYIIRKFQNMVARKLLNKDSIQIIYFGRKGPEDPLNSNNLKVIKIESNGTLSSDFGTGFIDEADSLAFELMKLRHSQKN